MGVRGSRSIRRADKIFSEEFIQKALCFRHPVLSQPKYEMIGFCLYPWESDYLAVSMSGYLHECEIKISHSDFLNEERNKGDKMALLRGEILTVRQFFHCDALDETPMQKPNYFWYVCPEGIISESEVPPFAGLIYVDVSGYFRCIRKAPCLHKVKFEDQGSILRKNMESKFYYSMWNWIHRYWRVTSKR